uniref:RloB domain-containing protein n=1 Tax=Succinivibrio sp. TaxID=2053619 RepID=UPI00402AE56A
MKHYRLINNVKVVSSNKGSSPENVLECAKLFIKKDGYDQAFCVFDKDKHSTYSSVVNIIKNIRNISSINSVPCFEYWLLLTLNIQLLPVIQIAILLNT